MTVRAWVVAAALLTSGCGAETPTQAQRRPDAQPPPGYVILPDSEVAAVLDQCSRGSPAVGQSSWRPSAAEIYDMEAAVGRALQPHERRPDNVDQWPQAWGRQYVGIVRAGRRYIYGNFLPSVRPQAMAKEAEAFVVCDGGRRYFGAEYDVASRRITHIDFNGPF